MLKVPFLSKNWMCANEDFDCSKCVLVGIPYDGTCSNRPGTRFAPQEIRLASWGLEEYSPIQDKNLFDTSFYDAGELDLPFGNREKILAMIKQAARETLSSKKQFFGIGGEHLVTLPVVEAYLEKYPDLAVIHFDAHADLRNDYLGEKLSHATVIRRIADKINPDRLVQIGIRSGTEEEFEWMKENRTLYKNKTEIPEMLKKLKNRPVFITIDLDVLDPSVMSGTGTPEPDGFSFGELINWLLDFKDLNIVGTDVLELSPHYDTTGVSTVMAAKVIRELLIMLS